MSAELARQITGVAALAEPVRRALYEYVIEQPEPVGRDQAAAAASVPRHVARFHLDRLVADGLLEVEFRRLTGRSGPGAGRPAKLYRRSSGEFAVSLPERTYDLAGDLMAQAIEVASRTDADASETLSDVAEARGRALGEESLAESPGRPVRDLAVAALRSRGYEPRVEGTEITLANCPFHALAREHTSLVCGMNLALLTGLGSALAEGVVEARLDPAEGRCCVVLTVGRQTDLATN